jgi:hypothetical protein
MDDKTQATITAADASQATATNQAPAADTVTAAPGPVVPQVGDTIAGRAIFGVRKVEGEVFVAFDADCLWLPLAGFQAA